MLGMRKAASLSAPLCSSRPLAAELVGANDVVASIHEGPPAGS